MHGWRIRTKDGKIITILRLRGRDTRRGDGIGWCGDVTWVRGWDAYSGMVARSRGSQILLRIGWCEWQGSGYSSSRIWAGMGGEMTR